MKSIFIGMVLYAAMGAGAQSYHVSSEIHVGGTGGWDYLFADSNSRTLYVSHSTEVVLIDMDSRKITGRMDGFQFVHGIIVLPKFGKGYITDGKNNEVSVFDPKSHAILRRIPTDANPNSMTYSKAAHKLFVGHKPSKTMSVIDPASDRIVTKIQLHGVPEFPVSEGHFVFVNIDDRAEIARIDTRTMTVDSYWPLGKCERPSGLAVDPSHHRLFSTCRNGIMTIVDSQNGKVVASVLIGLKPDAARYDHRSGLAFASGGDGTLTIIGNDGGDTYSVRQTVRTMETARTMEVDPRTSTVFLSGAETLPAQDGARPQIKDGSFRVIAVSPH